MTKEELPAKITSEGLLDNKRENELNGIPDIVIKFKEADLV